MTKTNKVVAAVTVGAIGVLALGSCSSGNDQAQDSSSPSASQSGSQESDREAAKANHVDNVTVPAPQGSQYSNVILTHQDGAKCSRNEKQKKLIIECANVRENVVGDAVFVRVPGKGYEITVEDETPHSAWMENVQRDYAANLIGKVWKPDSNTWKDPGLWSDFLGWSVGVDSYQGDPITVRITVSMT